MTPLNWPTKKYQVIYADPPWKYQGEMMNSSVIDHYSVEHVTELAKLPVKDIVDDSAVLFCWVTMPKLNEFDALFTAWGFQYKTCAFCWVKQNKVNGGYFMGQGRWTRANAELCLLGTRGSIPRISAAVRQLVVSPIEAHSKKPDEVRNRIVQLVGDLPRIELFARQRTEGWDAWGNEVPPASQQEAI